MYLVGARISPGEGAILGFLVHWNALGCLSSKDCSSTSAGTVRPSSEFIDHLLSLWDDWKCKKWKIRHKTTEAGNCGTFSLTHFPPLQFSAAFFFPALSFSCIFRLRVVVTIVTSPLCDENASWVGVTMCRVASCIIFARKTLRQSWKFCSRRTSTCSLSGSAFTPSTLLWLLTPSCISCCQSVIYLNQTTWVHRLKLQRTQHKTQTDRHEKHTHNTLHTHPFNGPLSGTTRVSQYQKGKTNLDFTEARNSEWQWHQLGHMQVCTMLQTYNHASTPSRSFLQAGCPSCRPTNSVKALKANVVYRLCLQSIDYNY